MIFHVKFVLITRPGNIMEFLLVMDVRAFLKDQSAEIANMYVKRKLKVLVLWIKHTEINAEPVV